MIPSRKRVLIITRMGNKVKRDYTVNVIIILVVMGVLSIWIGEWVLLIPVAVAVWFFAGTTWLIIIAVAALLAMFIIGC